MDLILWRHAEAKDLDEEQGEEQDLKRPLTSRGEKQAARMAKWLDRQLPDATRVLVSPALRCEQTALALSRKYKIKPELAPSFTADDLLKAAQWPDAKTPMLLVGHQPALGQAIAKLLGLQASDCAVRRGAVWWLRTRERDGHGQTVVVTVQSPEVL